MNVLGSIHCLSTYTNVPALPDILTGLMIHHKMDSGDISGSNLFNYGSSSASVVTGTFTVQTTDKQVGTASIRNTVSTNTQRITSTVQLPSATIGCNISFWMKSITNIVSGMFVSFLVGTARITLRTIAVNDVLRLEVNDGVNATTARNNLFTFTPSTWQHVSVNLHNTTPFVTCYVNGVMVTTTTDNIRVMYSENTYNMSIFGTAGGTDAQIWACDDFRVYNRPLSNVDVQTLYGLLHHLKFLAGDLTGSTIKNWGSGANATSNGTNAITGGVCTFGGASNAYIRLGGTYTVAYGTSITTSMYFKSNKAEVTNVNLFLSTLNSYGDGIFYELNPDGSIGVQINTVTNNAQNYRTSNVWNHIAVVYTFSSVSTSISLYVNGVLTGIGTSGPQSATNVRNSFIGHATWDANQFIVGSIRNFRWYSRALNTTEIATLATVD